MRSDLLGPVSGDMGAGRSFGGLSSGGGSGGMLVMGPRTRSLLDDAQVEESRLTMGLSGLPQLAWSKVDGWSQSEGDDNSTGIVGSGGVGCMVSAMG